MVSLRHLEDITEIYMGNALREKRADRKAYPLKMPKPLYSRILSLQKQRYPHLSINDLICEALERMATK
jgi:hypothetical protein